MKEHPGPHHVCQHRGDGHARHVQLKADDEDQIEHNVHCPGKNQAEQRPSGVAGGTEHCVAEVENAQSGHTQGVDSEIEHRSGQQILLGFQQLQQGRSQQQAQSGDEQSHQGA